MELNFPSIPRGGTLEAGMFGFGFEGPEGRLHEGPLSIPSVADPRFVVPIIQIDYGTGALTFCSDDVDSAVDVAQSTNFPARTSYPFIVMCRHIKPGATKAFNVSLRFGPAGAEVQDLSGDVLERYASKYPFQVGWKDRRPIGEINLAGPQINVPTNPRRWIMNFGQIDITNGKGKAAFRDALLKFADNSIQVLKDTGAQGMITWDVEGEEHPKATYYGDPRLASRLAPETGADGALDEYFAMFRNAGFRTGLTIRPQHIVFEGGEPTQKEIADPARELAEKIEYAKRRWGCTLFYVDSTYDSAGSLNADVFRALAQRFPDILLFPENENLRDFAYSAPLNSYHHHNVTGTPASVLDVYPGAFSMLMATTTDEKMKAGRSALLESVRRGDILLVNAWTRGNHIEFVKSIYRDAGR